MDCFASLAMTAELLPVRAFPLPRMIRQRQPHAVAQRRLWRLVLGVEEDAAVAAIAELRIELAKRLDQVGLAMEQDRILSGLGLDLIDPDRAAAFGLRREIAWLSPFQRLFDGTHALGRLRR